MSVPPVTHPCWSLLAQGGIPGFQTSHVALKFLIKKLQNGATPRAAAAELHQFFVKYERLLGAEINLISK